MSDDDIKRIPVKIIPSGLQPLPRGIVPHDDPVTGRDYIVSGPHDMRAVDELIHKIVCEERAGMATGGRLYIVMGERHGMPSNVLAQAGLVDNLTATSESGQNPHGKVIVSVENPKNLPGFLAREGFGLDVPEDFAIHESEKNDPLNHAFARAQILKGKNVEAPISDNILLSRVLQADAPLVLSDAMQKTMNIDNPDEAYEVLHWLDDEARIFAQRFYNMDMDGPDAELLEPENPDGMHVRNAVMAKRTIDAAQKHEADTVIVTAGSAHVEGDRYDGLPYETSLTKMFEEGIRPQDRIVTISFAEADDEGEPVLNTIPDEMLAAHPDHVIIRGLSSEAFFKTQVGPEPEIEQAELAHIEKLGQSYDPEAVPERFQKPAAVSEQTARDELQAALSLG